MNETTPKNSRLAYFLLFLTTVLWGTTFIFTKILTASIPIFWVTFIRHLIAFLGFIPFFGKLKKLDKKILGMALITGGANFTGLILQTYGLQTISSGKSAFLTGLYVIIIPLMTAIIFKRKIQKMNWIAVIIAFSGMSILIFNNADGTEFTWAIQLGDLLTIACAFMFAIQIIYTEKFSPKVDTTLLSMLQLFWIMVISLGFLFIVEPVNPLSKIPINLWIIWIILGVAGTTLPFFFQNWGQKHVSATPAALIFALEPVFATIFGYLIGNEAITWGLALGGGLIFIGVIISAKYSTQNPSSQSLNDINTDKI